VKLRYAASPHFWVLRQDVIAAKKPYFVVLGIQPMYAI
jgi:hypothetical protein